MDKKNKKVESQDLNQKVEQPKKIILTEDELNEVKEIRAMNNKLIEMSSNLGLLMVQVDETKVMVSSYQQKFNEENMKLSKKLEKKYGRIYVDQNGDFISLE